MSFQLTLFRVSTSGKRGQPELVLSLHKMGLCCCADVLIKFVVHMCCSSLLCVCVDRDCCADVLLKFV